MKRREVETVRRMCRGIIHSNQPALDLLSPDYIALAFLSLPLAFFYLSLGHCYKQLQQLMAIYYVSSSISDNKIVSQTLFKIDALILCFYNNF